MLKKKTYPSSAAASCGDMSARLGIQGSIAGKGRCLPGPDLSEIADMEKGRAVAAGCVQQKGATNKIDSKYRANQTVKFCLRKRAKGTKFDMERTGDLIDLCGRRKGRDGR